MSTPIGIIAGGGALPVVLAQQLVGDGSAFVIRLSGFADKALCAHSGLDCNIGEIGGVVEALRAADCHTLVFAGAVRRPEFASLKLDAFGQSHLPHLVTAARQGDDALLSALVAIFEGEGFSVVGAHQVCPDLLAPAGLIAGNLPDQQAMADLSKALRLARLIGSEDIGQGCVVADGIVLALEAQEGTDGMLQRLVDLPAAVRGTAERRRGVLVKCAKPQQDRRIDLPVIGIQTIENAAKAGLLGIGVEAGGCLIIDRQGVEDRAHAHGLCVMGLDHESLG